MTFFKAEELSWDGRWSKFPGKGRVGGMPYMSCIGMYRSEGYGFQVVYYGIGYINQRVRV